MDMPALTVLAMVTLFVAALVMVVVGGVRFMRGAQVLMTNRHRFAQGVVFAAAAFMFVSGIGVHFTGSSNTAFLKGQMQRASQCELLSEAANPQARGGSTGVISRAIISCMALSGYQWSEAAARCQDAPMASNGYCYQPADMFDRAITTAQLAFD